MIKEVPKLLKTYFFQTMTILLDWLCAFLFPELVFLVILSTSLLVTSTGYYYLGRHGEGGGAGRLLIGRWVA